MTFTDCANVWDTFLREVVSSKRMQRRIFEPRFLQLFFLGGGGGRDSGKALGVKNSPWPAGSHWFTLEKSWFTLIYTWRESSQEKGWMVVSWKVRICGSVLLLAKGMRKVSSFVRPWLTKVRRIACMSFMFPWGMERSLVLRVSLFSIFFPYVPILNISICV